VLFDTGLGQGFSQLMPTLELIGVSPADITTVVLSHFHPDHIGGVAPDGAVAFPNAQYVFGQVEWDFLNSGGNEGALGTLQPVVDAGQMAYYADGDEIAPGIIAVAAPGHTPGHTGFIISSGDQVLMNTVDAIVHPVLSVQRPEWHFGFDSDPEQAISTRRNLLDRVASDNLLIFGYHFPFPGIGVIAAEGDSWRFTPFSY
jgi:glyoxylase-like metal-dependent hydrolase (beta-lactamase superfamily II)